jgi:hypothetical protein
LRAVTNISSDKKERKLLAVGGNAGFCNELNRPRSDHENVS